MREGGESSLVTVAWTALEQHDNGGRVGTQGSVLIQICNTSGVAAMNPAWHNAMAPRYMQDAAVRRQPLPYLQASCPPT